jgi:hypothetical protein
VHICEYRIFYTSIKIVLKRKRGEGQEEGRREGARSTQRSEIVTQQQGEATLHSVPEVTFPTIR